MEVVVGACHMILLGTVLLKWCLNMQNAIIWGYTTDIIVLKQIYCWNLGSTVCYIGEAALLEYIDHSQVSTYSSSIHRQWSTEGGKKIMEIQVFGKKDLINTKPCWLFNVHNWLILC